MDGLVNTARASAQEATQASRQAILTGRTLLLAISGISVSGALLIAWLFVGHILIRRLKMLLDWMLRMAGGTWRLGWKLEVGTRWPTWPTWPPWKCSVATPWRSSA